MMELDSSLLREKELEQTKQMLEHRQAELTASRAYRQTEVIPEPPSNPLAEISQRLGLDPSSRPEPRSTD